ncbi:hypothetical protein BGZ94_009105 [Podila epigama]|nr:hypothetical protein BGZ94_009105 [Podila epigama]
MAPAPVASGAPRTPMPGRPSPFEARPTGGSVVNGGYDNQYDNQYDHYHHSGNGNGSQVGGYDAYNQGAHYDNQGAHYDNQGYYPQHSHGQQYAHAPAYDYGYDQHPAPPTSVPAYPPPGKAGEGGQYM